MEKLFFLVCAFFTLLTEFSETDGSMNDVDRRYYSRQMKQIVLKEKYRFVDMPSTD